MSDLEVNPLHSAELTERRKPENVAYRREIGKANQKMRCGLDLGSWGGKLGRGGVAAALRYRVDLEAAVMGKRGRIGLEDRETIFHAARLYALSRVAQIEFNRAKLGGESAKVLLDYIRTISQLGKEQSACVMKLGLGDVWNRDNEEECGDPFGLLDRNAAEAMEEGEDDD